MIKNFIIWTLLLIIAIGSIQLYQKEDDTDVKELSQWIVTFVWCSYKKTYPKWSDIKIIKEICSNNLGDVKRIINISAKYLD